MAFKNSFCLTAIFIAIAVVSSEAKAVYGPSPTISSDKEREVDQAEKRDDLKSDSFDAQSEIFSSGGQLIVLQGEETIHDNEFFQAGFIKNKNQVKSSSPDDFLIELINNYCKSRHPTDDLEECLLHSSLQQTVRQNYADILSFLSQQKNAISQSVSPNGAIIPSKDDDPHEIEIPTINDQVENSSVNSHENDVVSGDVVLPIQIQNDSSKQHLRRSKRQVTQPLSNLISNTWINGVVISTIGRESNYVDPYYIIDGAARANPPLTAADVHRIAVVRNADGAYRRAMLVAKYNSGYTGGVMIRF